MKNMRSFCVQPLSFPKTPTCLLAFFLLVALLPACKVKEGCTAAQKAAYTNSMDKKKRGKTALFPKSMAKKIKH